MNNKIILSPVTGSQNVVLERTIRCSEIIKKYNEMKPAGISVESFFRGLDEVEIYRCLDSGYRFYYPFEIAGDGEFYEKLEKTPNYYADWKWEYSAAIDHIKKGEKVLEIGCGKGSFLEKIRENGSTAEGVEMNKSAVKDCLSKGLSVYPDSIENFVKNKQSFYDVVCSFQVLEHITKVHDFLQSSVTALRSGGLMIIGVPNNDSSLFEFDKDMSWNMPPHHMGMWNINSLIKLQNYFDIQIEAIYTEPLQPWHFAPVMNEVKDVLRKKLHKKLGLFSSLVEKKAYLCAELGALTVAPHVTGHTMVAVFKKILP